MDDFAFHLSTKILYGERAVRSKLADEVGVFNASTVAVITDAGIVEAGLVQDVQAALNDAGVEHVLFDAVEPNPCTDTCLKAFEATQQAGAQAIVAVGGGSAMDVAKAAGILMTNGGDLESYEGANRFAKRMLPMVCVPTTAGTGSELTPFSIITIRARNYKMSIYGDGCLPQVALLDPLFVSTVPPLVAAACGMDALTHAVESFINSAGSPVTDAYACEAIFLIGKHLRAYVANRKDTEAGGAMLVASSLAGVAFGIARLGDAHAMAHPLGGFFDVPHGVATAILLPHVMRFNLLADCGKYARVAQCLGEDTSGASDREAARLAIAAVEELCLDLGLPRTLAEVGVAEDAIAAMSADAMKSGNIAVNPRQTTIEDIEGLYRAAM